MSLTTSSTASPALANGEGGGARPAVNRLGSVVVGGSLAVLAEFLLVACLIGAHVVAQQKTSSFIPEGAKLDDYVGGMIAMTGVLIGLTGMWVLHSLRAADGKYAGLSLGLLSGLSVGLAALCWWSMSSVGVGADSTFGGLFFTVMSATALIGLITVFLSGACLFAVIEGETVSMRETIWVCAVQAMVVAVICVGVWYSVWKLA